MNNKRIKNLKSKLTKKVLHKALLIFATILLLSCLLLMYLQYKETQKSRADLLTIGTEIQLGYHREFKLVERLGLVDFSTFVDKCEDFSFKCLQQGSSLREEFLTKFETSTFTDDDMEVINMVSNIDISVKNNIEQYNTLVVQYQEKVSKFPNILLKPFLGNIQQL